MRGGEGRRGEGKAGEGGKGGKGARTSLVLFFGRGPNKALG